MIQIKLLLFDLDGTLIKTGGAGLKALDHTFRQLFSIENVLSAVNPSGKTDPAIFREIMNQKLNRDMEEEDFNLISRTYLTHLKSEIFSSKKVRSLRGVCQFLNSLQDRPDFTFGLGTGNLEEGARIKLGPTQLNAQLTFGGFGSDAEDRSEMLKIGHTRAVEKTGRSISAADVFVIGDTRLDVKAAKKAGYRSISVASGSDSYESLKETGPDFIWNDMTDGLRWLEEHSPENSKVKQNNE